MACIDGEFLASPVDWIDGEFLASPVDWFSGLIWRANLFAFVFPIGLQTMSTCSKSNPGLVFACVSSTEVVPEKLPVGHLGVTFPCGWNGGNVFGFWGMAVTKSLIFGMDAERRGHKSSVLNTNHPVENPGPRLACGWKTWPGSLCWACGLGLHCQGRIRTCSSCLAM